MNRTAAVVVAFLLFAAAGWGQDAGLAIRGGTIHTGDGNTIEDGVILIEDGKITEIGNDVTVPDGVDVIDASGLHATPGLIDAYTHVGLAGQRADRDQLMTPARRTADVLGELNATEWLHSGVTTVYVSPGGENLVGGIGASVKLTGSVLREESGVSASFGETALRAFDAPTTRQGMVGILRQTLVRAGEDSLEGDGGRTFARVVSREIPLRVLVNTPDDILTALRLAKEFDLSLVLDSAAGGHVVADAIAAADVPVVVGPAVVGLGDGGPYEAFAHTPSNAATLHQAGVRIALGTQGFGRGRPVAMEAVIAKAHGLPESAALLAVTSHAANILGVEDRVGTLAPGMDADIVIWSRRPMTTWARAMRVIVDGKTVLDRSE